MITLRPVKAFFAPRRSESVFTLRSGLPGTKIRMLTFSSDGVCKRSELLDSLARYWKQCAGTLVISNEFCPSIDRRFGSAGAPSSGCQLASFQLGLLQLLSFETR